MSETENSGRSEECSENTVADNATAVAAGNQSIIGKMKSRVSGIFPNKIANWFKTTSSTATNSDNNSFNGSGNLPSVDTDSNSSRSRIELRDDDDDDEEWVSGEDEDGYVNYEEAALADNIAEHDAEDGESQTNSNYAINMLRQQTLQKRPGIREREIDDDDDDEDEDDGDELAFVAAPQSIKCNTLYPSSVACNSNPLYGKRSAGLPEMKRTRLSSDFYIRDSPMVNRQSRIASTPTVGSGAFMRSSTAMPTSAASASTTRTMGSRYSYMNLYRNRRESPYNFGTATTEAALATSGDLPTTTVNANLNKRNQSSQRSLMIPTSSEQQQRYNLPNLRRQSLSTVRSSGDDTLVGAAPGVIREQDEASERTDDQRSHINNDGQTININNNNINVKVNSINARQNLLNGDSRGVAVSTDVVSLDTASEASNEEHGQNKDNGSGSRSRTSSFGGNSGFNFNAHLQGPKSLFSGTNPPRQGPQQINNSTMSLNSLNYRRQFKASVYGSTSALSDSRLYNTLSPFYKGRTTYGGASAYNSYNKILSGNDGNTDAGTSFLRLKPTIIRPQSSLSTLASSSHSGAGINIHPCGITTINGEQLNISSAAQRILSLLKDFRSPLTEARKMGENLKDYRDLLHSKRLKETDLEKSRKSRLAQIRSPYLRPTPYQPGQPGGSTQSSNDNDKSSSSSPVINAPVRELQLPKIANWLKMRQQMAGTTERIQKIAMEAPIHDFFKVSYDYKLPVDRDRGNGKGENGSKGDDQNKEQQQYQQPQQLHQIKQTGKIRQKVSLNARVTSCKDDGRLDETLPLVNLPNIAFPIMQSIPKFDIELPKPVAGSTLSSSSSPATSIQTKNAFVQPSSSLKRTCDNRKNQLSSLKFQFTPPIPLFSPKELSMIRFKNKFNFISPQNGDEVDKKTELSNETKNSNNDDAGWKCESCGKVCACSLVSFCIFCLTQRDKSFTTTINYPKKDSSVKVPILSSFSVTSTGTTTGSLLQSSPQSNFGNKFKKSTSEWECDTCMVRNKEPAVRCIACETPRKVINTASAPALTVASSDKNIFSTSNSFGSAFKPKADTWECSVCLIMNKNDTDKCIACESKKPGAVTADNNKTPECEKPKLQFGFAPVVNTTATAATAPVPTVAVDDTFKSLVAAQKTSKWSCSACFAQNDAVRKKCICCEEPKPGTLVTPDGGMKFNFGNNPSGSASQFKFGFASSNDSVSVTTTATAITTVVSSSLSTAAPVSSVAAATGFSFGTEPLTMSTTTSGPDTADGALKPTTAFTFGFGSNSTSANPKLNNVKPTKSVSFYLPTENATSAAGPSTGFKLGSSLPSTSSSETVKTTSSTSTASTASEVAFKPISTQSLSAVVTESSQATTLTNSKFSFTTSLAAVASSDSKVATITSAALPISFTATNAVSAIETGTCNASGVPAAAAVPKNFSLGAFGSASTTSLTASSTPTNSVMSVFAANPANSSLSTNIADNQAAAVTTPGSATTTADLRTSTGNFNFGQPATASTTTSFIFGVQPVVAVTSTVANTTASIFGTTTSTINNTFAPNPSSTFIFGGSGESNALGFGAATAAVAGATPTNSANKHMVAASTSNIFGNFGGNTTSTSSNFGAPAALVTASTANSSSSLFNAGVAISNNQIGFPASAIPAGSSGFATAQNIPVFGAASPKFVGAAENSNIFGSSSSNNLRPFGMESTSTDGMMQQQNQQQVGTFSSFGPSSSAPVVGGPPPAKQKTFGTFGAAAVAASEMPKPASFNFNVPNATTPSTSGVFNFSANSGSTAHSISNVPTLKPAYNFTASPPTVNFNFTGTNPSGNNDHPYAANKPFIFGSTTTNPGMGTGMGMGMGITNTMPSNDNNNIPTSYPNSSGANYGMMEASSNAPFQFNAGAAPTANIFAINPTNSGGPGSQTAAQQARRKIRTSNRRLTQR